LLPLGDGDRCVRVDGGVQQVFVNGVRSQGTREVGSPPGAYKGTDTDAALPFYAGNRPLPDRDFDGVIDDVRISSAARSQWWIETEYASFASAGTPGTLVDVSAEAASGADTDLVDHPAGQRPDALGSGASATDALLFGFRLRNDTAAARTVNRLQVRLSRPLGIVPGDFGALQVFVDANGKGVLDGGEGTTVGGAGAVDADVTTLAFGTPFTIAAGSTVDYLVRGSLASLQSGDGVTLSLAPLDVVLAAGAIGGTGAASTRHEADVALGGAGCSGGRIPSGPNKVLHGRFDVLGGTPNNPAGSLGSPGANRFTTSVAYAGDDACPGDTAVAIRPDDLRRDGTHAGAALGLPPPRRPRDGHPVGARSGPSRRSPTFPPRRRLRSGRASGRVRR
jgi:hypothetical protein